MADESKARLTPTHMHQIYIRAPAGQIWDAITSPDWSVQYGYRAIYDYDLRAGGKFYGRPNEMMRGMGLPDPMIDGEVIEAKPPFKLVQTYRFLFSKENEAEGFTRVTFEIEDTGQGFCRLTITHELEGAPLMAGATSSNFNVRGSGGWDWILSDLKSLLETGKTLSG
ncbi:MAG: SRPBCC domain-containing protein [Steroidobacteraceae bacterium]